MRVTRQYRFSASHRLHTPALDEETNRRVFGKCNHPFGHGHDYLLQVSVRGPVNPESGLVASLARLDALVEEHVLRDVRDRNLNDLEAFRDIVATTENLALEIERRLGAHWPFAASLDGIRIRETRRNFFDTVRPRG